MNRILFAMCFLLIGIFGGVVFTRHDCPRCEMDHVKDSAYVYWSQHHEVRVMSKGMQQGMFILTPNPEYKIK